MNRKKCAVFSAPGLGDGLIALMLAHNLSLNGFDPIIYHPNQLWDLQSLYPHLPIAPFPSTEDASCLLSSYDKIFLSFDGNSKLILELIRQGKDSFSEKIYVMNPSPSKKKKDPSSYDDVGFSSSLNMVENTAFFCAHKLGFAKSTKDSGLILPPAFKVRKESRQIIIHPTCGRQGRSWPSEKFVKLALHLQKERWDPVFVMNKNEVALWPALVHKEIPSYLFSNLLELAFFVAQAGYMIGNDSGIGHLASALGLPTVTICRHYRIAKIWRPGWGLNEVVFPLRWIPNFHAFRLRDRHWKKFLAVQKVVNSFQKLLEKEKLGSVVK